MTIWFGSPGPGNGPNQGLVSVRSSVQGMEWTADVAHDLHGRFIGFHGRAPPLASQKRGAFLGGHFFDTQPVIAIVTSKKAIDDVFITNAL